VSCKPLITGALLGLEKSTFAKNKNCYEMTREEWIRRLDDMQGVGLNLLFIFGGVNEGLRRKAIASPDLLEFIFSECDRRRMEVIISASCWDDWQVGGIDISREMKLVEETTKEVYTRYGFHPSFSGWYLPYECNMIGGSYGKLLCELYRAGVEKCKFLLFLFRTLLASAWNSNTGNPRNMSISGPTHYPVPRWTYWHCRITADSIFHVLQKKKRGLSLKLLQKPVQTQGLNSGAMLKRANSLSPIWMIL
jgi:hypothetical protein